MTHNNWKRTALSREIQMFRDCTQMVSCGICWCDLLMGQGLYLGGGGGDLIKKQTNANQR